MYVKTARFAGDDVYNSGLRIEGDPRGQLEIVLGATPGSLDAVTVDEKQMPEAGVTVALVPDPSQVKRIDMYRNATSDASGKVHWDGVIPGDYKIYAWEDIESGAWADPEFMRNFEGYSLQSELEWGNEGTVPSFPSFLLHAHEFLDAGQSGVRPDLISHRRGMERIHHDFSGQRSIGGQEFITDVHVEDLPVVCDFGELAIDFLDRRTEGVIRRHTAREYPQNQDLRLWLAFLELFNNQPIALDDVIGRVSVDVVGSQHQNDKLSLEAFQLAILHAPQHALRRVGGDSEVRGVQFAKSFVPNRLANHCLRTRRTSARTVPPEIGDRVANEQQIDVALLCDLNKALMSGIISR
jgi:hypothetical protein